MFWKDFDFGNDFKPKSIASNKLFKAGKFCQGYDNHDDDDDQTYTHNTSTNHGQMQPQSLALLKQQNAF